MKFLKNTLFFLLEVFKIIAITLVIVIPIRYFLFQPFLIRGLSMEPNFHNGDYLIVDEISYRLQAPQRGEVIVFKYPKNPSQRFIKRIIGLPGETIEIKKGEIIINNQSQPLDESDYLPGPLPKTAYMPLLRLNENEYFVLGDNRKPNGSLDSRIWGPLPQKYIIGRVILRPWPVAAFAKIESPSY